MTHPSAHQLHNVEQLLQIISHISATSFTVSSELTFGVNPFVLVNLLWNWTDRDLAAYLIHSHHDISQLMNNQLTR